VQPGKDAVLHQARARVHELFEDAAAVMRLAEDTPTLFVDRDHCLRSLSRVCDSTSKLQGCLNVPVDDGRISRLDVIDLGLKAMTRPTHSLNAARHRCCHECWTRPPSRPP
jgi:hypothetical protein